MVILADSIPLLILFFITGIVTILLALGYVYRTSFPMSFMWFLSGIIFLFIFIGINSISLGNTEQRDRLDNSTISGNFTNYEYTISGNDQIIYDIKVKDINGNYTAEPNFIGIMLIILSLAFIMIGILIEKFN